MPRFSGTLKTIAKWAGVAVGIVLLLVAGLVGWVQLTYDVDHEDTPLPAIAAADDEDAVARGAYLVHAVAHCSSCHSPAENMARHELDLSAPLEGGNVWRMGPFGVFTAANLTPDATGIAAASDAELARAIRHGVSRDGRLAPMMRFGVAPMADEDIAAIIAYLRAQPPVAAARAPTKFGLLAKALSGRFQPRHEEAPPYVPAGAVSLERGRYLAEGPAGCALCHTPRSPMTGFAPVGEPFSGGGEPEPDRDNPGFELMAPNLTPHPTTGHIAQWSEDQFVARFAAGRVVASSSMPWEGYRFMTEGDVRSIYRYLHSVPAVERDLGPPYRRKGSYR